MSGIIRGLYSKRNYGVSMTEQDRVEKDKDGMADAVAATAIIALVVLITSYWLAGMPA